MSLWSVLGDVVSSVTEGVTDIVTAAIGEEGQEGGKNMLTAIGTVWAGTAEVSKAVVNVPAGLVKGVTDSITAASAANTTEEAIGAVAGCLTKSVADELVTGVRDLSKGSGKVVKGVRHGIGAVTEK